MSSDPRKEKSRSSLPTAGASANRAEEDRGTHSEELCAQIADEEERLAAIDRERCEVRDRLQALRRQLGDKPATTSRGDLFSLPLSERSGVPTTPAEKVKLFRSLFRGREEVFPTRFVSKKSGKPGYAPACSNKFVRGVCGLPGVKCGDCPNQAFLPVDDQVILHHLRGRHVMGIYPMLQDETCWFLAVDFDKRGGRRT